MILPRTIYIKGEKVKTILCVVADGMGGLEHGEVASKIAVDTFRNWDYDHLDMDYTKKDFYQEMKTEFCKIISRANKEVCQYEYENGMETGSTVVMLFIINNLYIVANIGDSRAYHFSRKPKQIPKDQTYEEAMHGPDSHILTQCLGEKEEIYPEFFKGKFKKGDFFLLCTDGMYNRVSIEELEKIIRKKNMGTKSKLTELIIQAKEKEEKDNISGILIQVS